MAVDSKEDRLAIARRQGAEVVNFEKEDPVETIVQLTGGVGVERAIYAVGVEAEHPHGGPAADPEKASKLEQDARQNAPEGLDEPPFAPRNAPSQALRWAIEVLAKAGTLSIIGVYPPVIETVPIRPGDEQEPDDQDGELQSSHVHPAPDRPRPRRHRESGKAADAGR